MKKIAASILGQDNEIDLINKLISNNINQIHYDVMDGKFVSNKSMTYKEVLSFIKKSDEHISDVHLMTIDPWNQIKELDGKVDYITFHFEIDINNFDKLLLNKKSKIGISIKPDTTINQIRHLLPKLSHVLIMSVEPGKGGQTFIEKSLNKIKELRELEPNIIIQVDGGINDETGPLCFKNGANSIVSGSYLINNLSKDIIKKLT